MDLLGFWIGVAGVGMAFISGKDLAKGVTIILLAINGYIAFGNFQ